MSGDAHVRICESLGVKFPRATRLVVSLNGRKYWLWRAVDQDGYVLDEIVQNRRNTKAAKRLLTRLLKKQGMAPKRMITDKLRCMEQQSARSCRMSNIDRIRALTIGRRIPMCRCENGSERCRASVRRVACSVSFRSSRPSATSSSHPAQANPHCKFACIASAP